MDNRAQRVSVRVTEAQIGQAEALRAALAHEYQRLGRPGPSRSTILARALALGLAELVSIALKKEDPHAEE